MPTTSSGPHSFLATFSVAVDMGNLPTLPERMTDHLNERLIWHLKDACEAIIATAQASLHELGHAPGAIVGPHIDTPGGLDTGLLRASLVYHLVDALLETGVYYDLMSDEADYWAYVEFGHWVVNAKMPWFWTGYHFLEKAIGANMHVIKRSIRAAWSDTVILLGSEARLPTPGLSAGTSKLFGR